MSWLLSPAAATITLGSLNDVTISGPINDEVLTYQSGTWVNQQIGVGSTPITITNEWRRGTKEIFLSAIPIKWRNAADSDVELLNFNVVAGGPVDFATYETFTTTLTTNTSFTDTGSLDLAQSTFNNGDEILIVARATLWNNSSSNAHDNGYRIIGTGGSVLTGSDQRAQGRGVVTDDSNTGNPYSYMGWFTADTAAANIKTQLKLGHQGTSYDCGAEASFFINLTRDVPNHVKATATSLIDIREDQNDPMHLCGTNITIGAGDWLVMVGMRVVNGQRSGAAEERGGFTTGGTEYQLFAEPILDSSTDKQVLAGTVYLENFAGGNLEIIGHSGPFGGECEYRAIIAIPLSDFANTYVTQANDTNRQCSAQGVDTDTLAVLSFTAPTTANYLCISWVHYEYTGTGPNLGFEIQEQVNGGGYSLVGWDNNAAYAKKGSDFFNMLTVNTGSRSYTSGQTIDLKLVAVAESASFGFYDWNQEGMIVLEMNQADSSAFSVGDPGYGTIIEGDSTNITSTSTDIDGTLNVDGTLSVGGNTTITGSLDQQGNVISDIDMVGGVLNIWDTAGTDYARFSHDGTDFNSTFLNTTDWNINIPGAVIVNDTIEITSTSAAPHLLIDALLTADTIPYIKLIGDNSVYLKLEADDNNTGSEEANPYIWFLQDGAIVVGSIGLCHLDLDARAQTFTGMDENGLAIHAAYSSGAMGLGVNGSVALHIDSSNNVEIRNGNNFRIMNSAEDDYAQFVHNGTDLVTSFVQTADWDITGLTGGIVLGTGVDMTSDFHRTIAVASGGLEANNTLTGGGFERVLTTSDLTPTYFDPPKSTDAALNAVANAINTAAGKVQGSMVYNTTTDNPVYAVGNADADIWVDGSGATANTPV